jgi:hypothetical protein
MKRSSWLALLMLLLVALVATFLWRPRAEGDAASADSTKGADLSSLASMTAVEVDEDERRIAPEAANVAAGTNSEPARAIRDGLVRVRVLHLETLEPLSGAHVRWAEVERLQDPGFVPLVFDPDVEERWSKHGRSTTSDAAGEVWLEVPSTMLHIEATLGNLHGRLSLWPDSNADQVLLLGPDDGLTVEVVHADGSPAAGVGVVCRSGSATNTFTMPEGFTGADGLVRLAEVRRNALGGGEGLLRVRACFLGPESVERLLDSRPWPTQIVRLELPPAGWIHVRCVDARGEPLRENLHVSVLEGSPMARTGPSRWFAKAGELELPCIASGQSIGISAQRPDSGRPLSSTQVKVAAPLRAGERVEVELVLKPPRFRLSGRALRPDGTPLVNAVLLLSTEGRTGGLGRATTAVDGKFEFWLHSWLDEPAEPPKLTATRLGLTAPLKLPSGPSDPEFHIGDVLLTELPLLASGRVVDEHGRGVGGATLGIEKRPRAADAEAGEWKLDRSQSFESERDGRFVLRRNLDDSELRLVAARGPRAAKPVEFEPGATDLQVVLPAGVPPLLGRVLVESHDATKHLRFECGSATLRWRDVGRFELQRKDDEPIDLEIFTDGESSSAEIPLVRIADLRDPHDPRLQAIDLRPLVRELRFEVLAPPGGAVRTLDVSAALPERMVWKFTSGPSVLVLVPAELHQSEPRLTVRLVPNELPPKTFHDVTNGARLQLARYPQIRLRIPDTLPEAKGDLTYLVFANTGGGSGFDVAEILAGRESKLALRSPGECHLEWRLAGSEKSLEVESIVVGEEDVECVLDAKLGDVEAAVAEARARRR